MFILEECNIINTLTYNTIVTSYYHKVNIIQDGKPYALCVLAIWMLCVVEI